MIQAMSASSATTTPEQAEQPFAWSDKYVLGYGPMDKVHEEFVDMVGQLLSAPDSELPARMQAFMQHAKAHFELENSLMEETEFPARGCHIDEHAAVMKSCEEVSQLLEQGNAAVCRDLARELAKWFPGHADYLDSALSHWMCKRRMGGKPVVLRRDIELR